MPDIVVRRIAATCSRCWTDDGVEGCHQLPAGAAVAPLIEIVDPDPSWTHRFSFLRDRLTEALGPRALRIDHVGSTAVPGLPAKDIVDVQVTVVSLSPALVGILTGAGFVHHPEIDDDLLIGEIDRRELRKLFFTEAPGSERANIHLREMGRRNQRYALLFRDHLRADENARDAYGTIKAALARAFPDDLDRYYEVKDPVMDLIYRGAEHWATVTGWSPS